MAAVKRIQPDSPGTGPISIDLKELAEYMGLEGEDSYEQIEKDTLALCGKTLKITDGNRITQVTLLAGARFIKDEGRVELLFSPALKPYLVDLLNRRN